MRAVAWCRLGDSPERIPLSHGDLIGRSLSAALPVDDPRVSEAHALVSLRGTTLQLLALRGRFRVHGRVVAEQVLTPGLVIELASDVLLHIDEVRLPEWVIGLEAPGLARFALAGAISVDRGPPPRVRPGAQPDADVQIWNLDDAWRFTSGGAPPAPLLPGDVVWIGDWPLTAVEIPLREAGVTRTHMEIAPSVHLEARFHTVQLTVGQAAPAVIGGQSGRLLAELVEIGGPVDWRVVAAELWADPENEEGQRRRWDAALGRLRLRLRSLGARADLVHTDGAGVVELLLRPGDRATVSG